MIPEFWPSLSNFKKKTCKYIFKEKNKPFKIMLMLLGTAQSESGALIMHISKWQSIMSCISVR